MSFFDTKERSIWKVEGHIVFKCKATFDASNKIAVRTTAELIIRDEFYFAAKTEIACYKKNEFGNYSLLLKSILVQDTVAFLI